MKIVLVIVTKILLDQHNVISKVKVTICCSQPTLSQHFNYLYLLFYCQNCVMCHCVITEYISALFDS